MKKRMRGIFSLCLVLALVIAMFVVPFADAPTVSDEAFVLFKECAILGRYVSDDEILSVDALRAKRGELAASQYAGAIVRFYDTGNLRDLERATFPLVDFFWENKDERLLTPLGNGDAEDEYANYVPGSASNEVVVTEQPFPDVPVDAWYAEAVAAMKDSGIITGCDDGLFHPEREVTVGEWCTLLLRAGTKRDANVFGTGTYDHWATGAVQMADALSLTSSFVRGQYCSGIENEFVNRGEAAKGVARLSMSAYNPDYDRLLTPQYAVKQVYAIKKAELEGHPLKVWTGPDIPDWNVITGPNDSVGPHSWRSDLILRLYNLGYVKGTDGNGTFDPWKTLTRAEVAQMLYNAHFDTRDYACLPNKGTGWNFYPDKFQ